MEKEEIIRNNEREASLLVIALNGKLFMLVNDGKIRSYTIDYLRNYLDITVWLRIGNLSSEHVYQKWSVMPSDFRNEDFGKLLHALEDDVENYIANAQQKIAEVDAKNETAKQKIERLEAECARLEVENNQLKAVAAL